MSRLVCVPVLLFAFASFAPAADWWQFGGPAGDGDDGFGQRVMKFPRYLRDGRACLQISEDAFEQWLPVEHEWRHYGDGRKGSGWGLDQSKLVTLHRHGSDGRRF